jgi:hypothetical protein
MKINTMFGTICIGCYTGNTVGLSSTLTLPATSTSSGTSVGSYGGIGLSTNVIIPNIPGIQLDIGGLDARSYSGSPSLSSPLLDYVVGGGVFTFSAINLKPRTQHTWIFANQTGTVTTDRNGAVGFIVNFNPGSGTYSTLSAALSTINGLTGGVIMSLSTADNTSSATCTVTLITGGTAPVVNPTTTIIPIATGGPTGLGYGGPGIGGRISCGVARCGSCRQFN